MEALRLLGSPPADRTDDRGLFRKIRPHGLYSAPGEEDTQRRVYINICLPKVFEAWTARRPNKGTRGLLLHHGNASANTAAATLDYLEANRVQLATKSLYSQGLAPCDFFLFLRVKQELKGKQFQGVEDAPASFDGVISDMPKST